MTGKITSRKKSSNSIPQSIVELKQKISELENENDALKSLIKDIFEILEKSI